MDVFSLWKCQFYFGYFLCHPTSLRLAAAIKIELKRSHRKNTTNTPARYESIITCEGEKGSIFTGVLLGVMESLGSGDRAIRRRVRRLRMEGGVAPPGEIGINSPLLPLLSSCRALPSNRNCKTSGLWLSSGRSKSAKLHQPSRSCREIRIEMIANEKLAL